MAGLLDSMLFSQDAVERLYQELRRELPEGVPVYRHTLPEKWNVHQGLAVVIADGPMQASDTAHDRQLVRVTVHAPTLHMARKFGRSISEYLFSPFGGLGLAISRPRSTFLGVGPDSLAGGYVSTASYSCGTSRRRITHGN